MKMTNVIFATNPRKSPNQIPNVLVEFSTLSQIGQLD